MKKKYLKLLVMVLICCCLPYSSCFAKTKRKTDKKTFILISTDKEIGSTKVSTFLNENATKKNSKKVVYNNRNVTIWHEDNMTHAKATVTMLKTPFHTKNGKSVKTFSWKNMSVVHTINQKVTFSKKNTTSVTYSPNTKVELQAGYMVGNSLDHVHVSNRIVKLPLKY